MFKYPITASVCCITFQVNAATVLLKDYNAPKNEEFKAFNELYLKGLTEGFLTANAKLAADGKPKLFCLPRKEEEVTAKQTAEIIAHQAKAVPDADNYPISILLLAGLVDIFPCEERTRKVLVHPRGVESADNSDLNKESASNIG
jgi:hypothetical protein